MRSLLLFFCAMCAWAQSGIDVPAVGVIVDSAGALRQVQGVAGSFLLGPASISGVLSAACSEQVCLVKTDSRIISATGATDAPAGPAIFGFSGDHAILFFPEVHLFARWHDDTLDALDWMLDGEILSVRLRGREADIAVRRDGQVWVVHPDGSVADSIADATGPVLLLPEGVLFATEDEIVLRRADSEVRFELTGAENIVAMGSHYAAIDVSRAAALAGGVIYTLRIDAGRESLFLLPGSVP